MLQQQKYWPQTATLSYFAGQWEMRGEIYPDNPATIIGYWTRGSGVGLCNHWNGLNNHGNWIYRLNKYPALNREHKTSKKVVRTFFSDIRQTAMVGLFIYIIGSQHQYVKAAPEKRFNLFSSLSRKYLRIRSGPLCFV